MMLSMSARSVSHTCAVPTIVGFPLGTRFTAFVAALVSVSSVPPPSVKLTRTVIRLPCSAAVSVYVAPVAPAISSSSASHW